MGLLDKIEELQQKPESYRRKVLIISVTIIMLIIVSVWLSIIRLRLREGLVKEVEKDKNEIYAPLKIFKEDLSRSFGEVKNTFGEILEQIEENE